MLRFRLFGITVHIQPMFWLIMAFLGRGMTLISDPSPANFYFTIIFVIAGFISIVVHEYGHALIMQKYGRAPQIILHGLGGVAISSGERFTRKENFIVSLAGPGFQLALALVGFVILQVVGDNFPTPQSKLFIQLLYYISLIWACLNLIPIYPLDGGHIFSSIVGPSRQKLVHQVGIGIGIVAGVFCLLTSNLWGLMILGLLTYDNIKALQRY